MDDLLWMLYWANENKKDISVIFWKNNFCWKTCKAHYLASCEITSKVETKLIALRLYSAILLHHFMEKIETKLDPILSEQFFIKVLNAKK